MTTTPLSRSRGRIYELRWKKLSGEFDASSSKGGRRSKVSRVRKEFRVRWVGNRIRRPKIGTKGRVADVCECVCLFPGSRKVAIGRRGFFRRHTERDIFCSREHSEKIPSLLCVLLLCCPGERRREIFPKFQHAADTTRSNLPLSSLLSVTIHV